MDTGCPPSPLWCTAFPALPYHKPHAHLVQVTLGEDQAHVADLRGTATQHSQRCNMNVSSPRLAHCCCCCHPAAAAATAATLLLPLQPLPQQLLPGSTAVGPKAEIPAASIVLLCCYRSPLRLQLDGMPPAAAGRCSCAPGRQASAPAAVSLPGNPAAAAALSTCKQLGNHSHPSAPHHVVQQLQPLVVASALAVQADAAAHHGVLAHQDLGVIADGLQARKVADSGR